MALSQNRSSVAKLLIAQAAMQHFGFIYYLFMFGLAARLDYEPASKSLRFRVVLYAALGAVSFAY